MSNTKNQIAMYSAVAALNSSKANGKNVIGSFDEANITSYNSGSGCTVIVENKDLRYTIKFNHFGLVTGERLEAFVRLFGFFPSCLKTVYCETYNYGAGYQAV